jgi:hypothetical protein
LLGTQEFDQKVLEVVQAGDPRIVKDKFLVKVATLVKEAMLVKGESRMMKEGKTVKIDPQIMAQIKGKALVPNSIIRLMDPMVVGMLMDQMVDRDKIILQTTILGVQSAMVRRAMPSMLVRHAFLILEH